MENDKLDEKIDSAKYRQSYMTKDDLKEYEKKKKNPKKLEKFQEKRISSERQKDEKQQTKINQLSDINKIKPLVLLVLNKIEAKLGKKVFKKTTSDMGKLVTIFFDMLNSKNFSSNRDGLLFLINCLFHNPMFSSYILPEVKNFILIDSQEDMKKTMEGVIRNEFSIIEAEMICENLPLAIQVINETWLDSSASERLGFVQTLFTNFSFKQLTEKDFITKFSVEYSRSLGALTLGT